MSRRHWPTGILAVALGLLLVVGAASGAVVPLRVSNLVVTNSDNTLLVNLVLLGAMPEGIGAWWPSSWSGSSSTTS